jgi:2-oxo-4-hydroxy-4-carboxy-5-ureidoimidazoline decarboxylase
MDGFADCSKTVFLEKLGHIFEHSPWVVENAWNRRPFVDAAALHAALMAEVAAAGDAAQLDLIRAHPELAARVELTEASASEQMGAGLKQLSSAEFERFTFLNTAYREKFGFPFIICVRLQTKASILAAFEARLQRDPAKERAEAIAQIGLIARLRLQDLMEGTKG